MGISRIINKVRNNFAKKKISDLPFKNDKDKWIIACVAMDTLEDTQLAIEYYKKNKGGKSDGGNYLGLYGVLQAVFLQQYAVKYLYKGLIGSSLEKFSLDSAKEIKDLRNLTVGHPIDKEDKDGIKRCFLSRVTIHKHGFQYSVWDATKKKQEFTSINLWDLLNKYEKEASVILQEVSNSLEC